MTTRVYETLIARGGEVVGALAYSFYKQHKVEWIIEYTNTHNVPPDDHALSAFSATATLPGMMQGYLERGQTLAQHFLTTGLEQKIMDINVEVRQSALASSMKDEIAARFAEKKTVLAYLRDAGTSIVTNLIALILAGALILGWKSLDDISAAITKWAKAESSTTAVDSVTD